MALSSLLAAVLLGAALPALPAAVSGSGGRPPVDDGRPMPAERIFSLGDAVAVALKNDSRLLSAEQDRIIAGARVTEARLQFLPEFGLQASATKFDSRYPFALSQDFRNILLYPGAPENIYSARGYVHFPIYEGGRSVNTVRMTLAAQQQALSQYETVKMEVVLAVKEAFTRFLFAQEKLAATMEAGAAQRLAAGLALSPWDRIEAERLAEQSRHWNADASREMALRRLELLKTLNLELDTPVRVEGRLEFGRVEFDFQRAALWALELRPELKSETYRAEMDAIGVSLAMGRRTPTLFVAGDYEMTAQRFPIKNNNWDIGVGLRLPLTYDFFTQLRQKRAEQRQGQLKRAGLQDQVRLEVRQAGEHLGYWQQEAFLRGQQSRAVSDIYEKAAPSAAASLAQLRALMTVLEMRLTYLEAVTEHTLARARVERAVGRDLAP